MPSEFRFLVMCLFPTREGGEIKLNGVINDLSIPADAFPALIDMYAVVGVVLREPMWGKSLDLMAWRIGPTGQREKLDGYVGKPLILPREKGAVCCPFKITVPLSMTGVYGFDLFDREGLFGPAVTLLATYLYGVHGVA
jgi:hypothetical protein